MLLSYNHQPLKAAIHLPGSKSISNRLLILNEVLNLNLEIENLSASKDTKDLIKALNEKSKIIDIGHAGTDMRFLTALLSTKNGEWILTGSERMKERPIKELVDALLQLGADIGYIEKNGYPPLNIKGTELPGGKIEIDSSVSSQFISALLLIAPSFKNGIKISLKGKTVSRPYINMTVGLLKYFGVKVDFSDQQISVKPLDSLITNHKTYFVEPDWSCASYWYSLVAFSKKAEITLPGLLENSLQGDSVLPLIYKDLGVNSQFKNNRLILTHSGNFCSYFKFDFTDCPDLAQTVAVTCFGLSIDCSLTGLSTLKHKETDRLLALKTELEKFGATVCITSDSLELKNTKHAIENTKRETVSIATYNDHRMAMSFSPLSILYENILIENPEVVEKSYPDFWKHISSIGIKAH